MQTTKLKTNELIDVALHWAVAKCQGLQIYKDAILAGQVKEGWWISGLSIDPNDWRPLSTFNPSANWAQGGPIIEREKIAVAYEPSLIYDDSCRWKALAAMSDNGREYGPTPLVAAMRCYVASKLGDEIDIPDDVCQLGSS